MKYLKLFENFELNGDLVKFIPNQDIEKYFDDHDKTMIENSDYDRIKDIILSNINIEEKDIKLSTDYIYVDHNNITARIYGFTDGWYIIEMDGSTDGYDEYDYYLVDELDGVEEFFKSNQNLFQ